jgi:hypothetical protein
MFCFVLFYFSYFILSYFWSQALNNLGSLLRIAGHIELSLEQYLLGFSMISEDYEFSTLVESDDPLHLYTIGKSMRCYSLISSLPHSRTHSLTLRHTFTHSHQVGLELFQHLL